MIGDPKLEPSCVLKVDIEMRQGQFLAHLHCNFGDAGNIIVVLPCAITDSIQRARQQYEDCVMRAVREA